jgi:hypothetical protein
MEFLYGDSTPSPLTSNFLEFLRDSLDFAVFILHLDDEIAEVHERTRRTARAADDEIQRLETLGRVVTGAVEGVDKGDAESETSKCSVQIATMSFEAVAAAAAAVREKLEARRAELRTEEATQRDACFKALETLLLPHSPPESALAVRVVRGPDRGYSAWRRGETPFGLRWRIELGIPHASVFASEAPMDRLAPHVEIHAPEQAGWLKKEVKLRAQRLDRLVLSEVVDDGRTITLRLRTDAASEHGLDFDVDTKSGSVVAMRVGAPEDPSAGAFDLQPDDVTALVAVAEKVRAAAGELSATRLVEATLGDKDAREASPYAGLVAQLVALMAPIVHEVARHSLNTTELILRRQLSSERREEIFVAKETLREKFMSLRPELRAIFMRLGLDTLPPPARRSSAPSAPSTPEENDWPAARAEISRSDPPPKPSRPPPVDPSS